MKVGQLIKYSIIYGLAVVAFCIYWWTNYSTYTNHKDDEFSTFAQCLLSLTCLFYATIQITVKKISFLLALSIAVVPYTIGIIIFMVTDESSVPRHYIPIYGSLNGAITLIAAYMFWNKPQKIV